MANNKSEKKTIWIYAVILFTSAFVVLLLTAYSQIKFNKNIDEYKSKITTEEKQKVNFKTDLTSAQDENIKLKDTKKSLELEITKLKAEAEKLKEDMLNTQQKDNTDKYEALIAAENLFEEKKYAECAENLLRLDFKPEMIGEKGFLKYTELVEKTYKIGAEEIFKEGYQEYLNKHYPSAIKRFRLSLNLVKNEYYSDDCLFLLANAEYNSGNKEEAKGYLNQLIVNYKDSNYFIDAENLLSDMENKGKL